MQVKYKNLQRDLWISYECLKRKRGRLNQVIQCAQNAGEEIRGKLMIIVKRGFGYFIYVECYGVLMTVKGHMSEETFALLLSVPSMESIKMGPDNDFFFHPFLINAYSILFMNITLSTWL